MSYTLDGFTDCIITNRETNNFYHTDDFNLNITHENFQLDFSAEFDTSELLKVLGLDLADRPSMFDIKIQKPVQVRKHKKRRINKKWAKRYGYNMMNVVSKGWGVKSTENGFEFIKEM